MAHDHGDSDAILSEYAEALSPNLRAEFVSPHLHEIKFESPDYRPLEVSEQGTSKKPRENFFATPHCMNLVAASKRTPHIYFASQDHIAIYDTPTGEGVNQSIKHKEEIERPFEPDGSEGYLFPYHPYTMTNMYVGEIGGEEVLVTTDDSGHVVIYFTANNFSRPPLFLKLPMSAWGIHTHSENRLLAVSCNAHIVTLFHLGMGIAGWGWTTATPAPGENIAKLVLQGHTNNIPCVAFDTTGNYVASGSIDCSIRIWSCKTGSCVKFLFSPRRVWSIRWVNKSDFKHFHRSEEELERARKASPDSEEPNISETHAHHLLAALPPADPIDSDDSSPPLDPRIDPSDPAELPIPHTGLTRDRFTGDILTPTNRQGQRFITRLLMGELVRQRFGPRGDPSAIFGSSLEEMIYNLRRPEEGYQEFYDRMLAERQERIMRRLRNSENRELGNGEDGNLMQSEVEDDDFMAGWDESLDHEHGDEEDENEESHQEGGNVEHESIDLNESMHDDVRQHFLVPEIRKYSHNDEDFIQTVKHQLLIFTAGGVLALMDPLSGHRHSIIYRLIKPFCSLQHHHHNDHFPFLHVHYPHPHKF